MNTQLPDRVNTRTGGEAWRIAAGKLCRGREVNGTYEEHPNGQVLGYLRRVGIYDGIGDDGTPYQYVEADFERNGETVSVRCSTGSINASLTMIRSLLEVARGELIALEPRQGATPTKKGGYPTYVNIYRVDEGTWKTTPIKPERDERDLDQLLDALRAHPAYAERPRRATDSEGEEFHAFNDLVVSRGWPAVLDHPSGYLQIIHKATKIAYDRLSDVPPEVWAQMATSAAKATKLPAALAAVPVEADPFESEG